MERNEDLMTIMQAKLARLKRENARLEMENSFLKKAAAYFAKGSGESTQ